MRRRSRTLDSIEQHNDTSSMISCDGNIETSSRKMVRFFSLVPLSRYSKTANRAPLRARFEHPFRIVNNISKYNKTRYKGLAKNDAHFNMLFVLSNLKLARGQLSLKVSPQSRFT